MVKNNNQVITLKTVTDTDHKFLYELLENRDSRANISHKKMPTYRQHVKFVKSKPYLVNLRPFFIPLPTVK